MYGPGGMCVTIGEMGASCGVARRVSCDVLCAVPGQNGTPSFCDESRRAYSATSVGLSSRTSAPALEGLHAVEEPTARLPIASGRSYTVGGDGALQSRATGR